MAEPFQRLTAGAARSLVEAHRLGLNDLGEVLEPLYEEIRDIAREGGEVYSRALPLVCSRERLAAVLAILKDDGYIVDVDAGMLFVKWGRTV